jgi:hypothetical protein
VGVGGLAVNAEELSPLQDHALGIHLEGYGARVVRSFGGLSGGFDLNHVQQPRILGWLGGGGLGARHGHPLADVGLQESLVPVVEGEELAGGFVRELVLAVAVGRRVQWLQRAGDFYHQAGRLAGVVLVGSHLSRRRSSLYRPEHNEQQDRERQG